MIGDKIMQSEPDDGETAAGKPDAVSRTERPKQLRLSPAAWLGENSLLENATRILQRLVFVAAAAFAVVEYVQDRQNGIEQEAFELVKIWETPEYQGAFQTVRSAIAAAARSLGNPSEQRLSSAQVAILHANIGWSSLTGDGAPEALRAVESLIYFGNRVGYCESRGLCDHDTLVEFFGDTLLSIRSYYTGYMVYKRTTQSPGYGDYLDRFLRNAGHAVDRHDPLLEPPPPEVLSKLP